jgi:hypothetical protein
MNATAKLEISVLAAALTLGIIGDALLRSFPWGVNFALWAGLLAAAIYFLGRERAQAFSSGGGWLMLPVVLSPAAFLWHESTALKALSMLCLLTALSLVMLRAQGSRLRTSSLVKYAVGGVIAGFNTGFGALALIFGNTEWKKSFVGTSRHGLAVVRGVAFSLVPLLIFGSLLMAADAVFKSLIHNLLHFDFTHLALVAFLTFWAGGYLRGILFGKELSLGAQKVAPPALLGAIDMGVLLGLLDFLFLAFVAVQFRFFFGGSALVHSTTGLTYSEYARRGFFQLLAVAALLLPFLLMVHWLLRPDDASAQRLFKWLAGFQIALLFVIMASALQRLRLYQTEYGLSEQRLYPTAFLGWLAVVFIWFCLTVLRGHRERFAFGAMVAGFLLVATLHAINPDALIARTNIERARSGLPFDAHYVSSLSADAVPEILAGLQSLNPVDRRKLAKAILENWAPGGNPDWRSWNLSGAQARQAIAEHEAELRADCAKIP